MSLKLLVNRPEWDDYMEYVDKELERYNKELGMLGHDLDTLRFYQGIVQNLRDIKGLKEKLKHD